MHILRLQKISNNNKGLALVETMMAIMVFGLVLAGMLDVCAQSILVGKRSDLSYNAYSIAKNHLETLRSLSFGSLATASETDTYVDGSGVPDQEGLFKRNTTVQTNYLGDADLVQVTVSVDYMVKNSFAGRPASLTTVIYQYA